MGRNEGAVAAAQSELEIVSSRSLDASPDRVFRAFSDPAILARWWGPAGFSNTFHEFSMRPGGIWRFEMHGPDGVDYPNESVFVAVVPNERIVLKHLSGPVFRLTVTLENAEGRTKLSWKMVFDSAEECANVRKFAPRANEENFDRLEAELARIANEAQSGHSAAAPRN